MIIDSVLAMKTNANLKRAFDNVSSRQLSQQEISEQRVSFVFGSMDASNGITKEKVRQFIRSQSGEVEVAAG